MGKAVVNGEASLHLQIPDVVGIEAGKNDLDPLLRHPGNVFVGGPQCFHGRKVGSCSRHHGNAGIRDVAGYHPALPNPAQDQIQVELLPQLQSPEDVAGPVHPDHQGTVTADDGDPSLEVHSAQRVLPAVSGEESLLVFHVVTDIGEDLSQP